MINMCTFANFHQNWLIITCSFILKKRDVDNPFKVNKELPKANFVSQIPHTTHLFNLYTGITKLYNQVISLQPYR